MKIVKYVAGMFLFAFVGLSLAPLVPFLLEGIAAQARLNQGDGIHPNIKGQRLIADLVWPHLKALLVKPRAGGIPRAS